MTINASCLLHSARVAATLFRLTPTLEPMRYHARLALLFVVALAACGGASDAPSAVSGGAASAPAAPASNDAAPPAREARVPAASALPPVNVQRVFPALSFRQPVQLLQAPGDDGRWYVLEKGGRVFAFANRADVRRAELVLDLRDAVDARSEGGLLGMAFAPDFSRSGRVYLSYTRRGGGAATMQSVIARYVSHDGGRTLDPASGRALLVVDQPYVNHNGGGIAFGPDGLLYVALGDGGAAGDPHDHGQNTRTLLGAFLRLDVAGDGGYAIPADNPFAGNPPCAGGQGARDCPELYAWGLRNPWRWSFDRVTGRLWAGDVGQNAREEINVIERGGNYGWRWREGLLCYRPVRDCPSAGLIDPVLDYRTGVDGNSITGGHVYRGAAIPGLYGHYVFGDFVSGRVWALVSEPDGRVVKRELAATGLNIPAFAEDHDGELYLLDFGGGLYRLEAAGPAP